MAVLFNVTAPAGENLQAEITRLWSEELGYAVAPDDNFFQLGGNSIKALHIMNRLQDAVGGILHPATIFYAPTVGALAQHLLANYPDLFLAGQSPNNRQSALTPEQEEIGRAHLRCRNSSISAGPEGCCPKNRPAAFILCPPRSGSTLLRTMLGGSPELFCPPEIYLLSYRTLGERRESFSQRRAFFRDGLIRALMELRDCPYEAAAALMEKFEADNLESKAFFSQLQEWAGARLVVDKTPSYVLNPAVLLRAEREFENALFIHLVRHPMATINSFEEIRADQVTGSPDEELPFTARQKGELWWQVGHRNALEFLDTIPESRRIQVSYEDLVTDPESAMLRLADFLNVSYTPEMVVPYKNQKSRMADGVTENARMLGDQKFATYDRIETANIDRWKTKHGEMELSPTSMMVAERLGYLLDASRGDTREEWII